MEYRIYKSSQVDESFCILRKVSNCSVHTASVCYDTRLWFYSLVKEELLYDLQACDDGN
jgi:hypothetical protein